MVVMIVARAVMIAILKIVVCWGMGTSGHTRTGKSRRATFDGKRMRRIGFGQVTPGHLSIDVDRVLTLSTIRPIIEQGIPEHERLLPPGTLPKPRTTSSNWRCRELRRATPSHRASLRRRITG